MNNESAKMEQEVLDLKEAYKKHIIRQNKMRRVIYEGEEKMEFLERDIKELERRLYDKQEFLRELEKFRVSDSIIEAANTDDRLVELKHVYAENNDKFLRAREEKITLEQKQELLECRAHALDAKTHALTCELHHLRVGAERKTEETQRSAENAAFSSNEYEQLEEDMDAMRKRMLTASQRTNSLTMQIANKETEIRSMKFNRMEMEKTIKTILVKVQEQIGSNEEL